MKWIRHMLGRHVHAYASAALASATFLWYNHTMPRTLPNPSSFAQSYVCLFCGKKSAESSALCLPVPAFSAQKTPAGEKK